MGKNMIFENRNATFKKVTKFGLASLTAGAISIYSLPAYAQVDEIVVSARKTTENLQDVPVSVSAFTGDFIQDSGAVELADVAALTPNFTIQEDGVSGSLFANIQIRGLTAVNTQLSSDQAVGILVNGAPVTRGTNILSNLFDVEQVEILKGPQGTLFGKNTTGGTVIIRTTTPKLGEFEGYVEAEFGNFDRTNFSGVANIPVGENFALRLGAASQKADGYAFGVMRDGILGGVFDDPTSEPTGNEFSDDDEIFYRASALYEPNDQLSIRLNADYHEVDENGAGTVVLNNGPLPIGPGVFLPIAVATLNDDFFAVSDQRPFDPRQEANETNLNATITYDFGGITFESVTSYRDQEAASDVPFAGFADVFFEQNSDIFAQEVRLSGNAFDDRLKWQGGVFYATEEGNDLRDVADNGQESFAENDTLAVFAQGTFAVTDRFNLTAGIRQTEEDRGLAQIGQNLEPLVPLQEADFSGTSWTVAADYKLTEDILTYASVSRGFRSGSIDGNLLDLIVTDNQPLEDLLIDPEFVTTYEIGYKADFFDNRVRWNTSGFFSDYTNIQLQGFDPDAVDAQGNAIIVIQNAGEAEIFGFESELTYVPSDNITIGGSVGYTDADLTEFDDVQPDGTIDDRSDDNLGGPEWTISAFGRYDHEFSEDLTAGIQLNYTYRSEEELEGEEDIAVLFEDPSQLFLEGYGLVHGQIDFDYEPAGVNVAFYGRNLLDNEHNTGGFALTAFSLDLAQRFRGSPREYGVRVRKSF